MTPNASEMMVNAACSRVWAGSCAPSTDSTARSSRDRRSSDQEGSDSATAASMDFPRDEQNPSSVQQSFIHHYAAQCGFCTPGLIVAATAYIEGGGSGDTDEIAEAISGHVCRCTGYSKILDAISAATSQDEFDMSITAPDPRTVVITGGDSA